MRFLLFVVAVVAVGAIPLESTGAAHPAWEETVKGLIRRIAGEGEVDKFSFESIAADEHGNDVFELENGNGVIVVRGNTGVAAASGFYYYLREYCQSSVTWGVNGTGNNVHIPSPLPKIDSVIRIASPVKLRYSWNVCTFDYTAAFWDWDRWERELDWLALHGYNMPLAFVGQEVVWRELYQSVGVSDEQLSTFFSGPAFLAWQRMGNIQGWGGPLPLDWIESQGKLQKNILARARAFGMTPVLPGFAGHIPKAIVDLFPHANVTRSQAWGGFDARYTMDYLLEPTDPLFQTLGVKMYEIQARIYGTDHYYNADTFNEMDPSSHDSTYLADTNKAIYAAMHTADAQAVFVMQGWLFYNSKFWGNTEIEAFLSGVANDKMIILDLNSETGAVWKRTNNYFGKQWIYNVLLSFGGVRGLFGNLEFVATDPLIALEKSNGTMVGMGFTPEDSSNNPVCWELLSEMGWRHQPVTDVDEWVRAYSARRYGVKNSVVMDAWVELRRSAYMTFSNFISCMDDAPALTMYISKATNATGVVRAAMLLTQAGLADPALADVSTFRYDLVDVVRQALVDAFYDVTTLLEASYQRYQFHSVNSTVTVARTAEHMLRMIEDMDDLLKTDPNFLLGTWIADARAMGSNDAEKSLLEFNARNILTMWGPNQNIEDYASKDWSGLMKDYYHRRWDHFLTRIVASVRDGTNMDWNAYQADRLQLEQGWSNETTPFPTTSEGVAIQQAARVIANHFADDLSVEYEIVHDVDAPHNDILVNGPAWVLQVDHLRRLCNLDTECQGFNSNGYLKTDVSHTVSSPSTLLYRKKSAL